MQTDLWPDNFGNLNEYKILITANQQPKVQRELIIYVCGSEQIKVAQPENPVWKIELQYNSSEGYMSYPL